jgi:hypothetical protein
VHYDAVDHLAPALRVDPDLIAAATAAAGDVLRRHGEDLASAEPTQGWMHPGWMSRRLVVRVGLIPGDTGLRKEAQVAAVLSPAIGYPDIVEVGLQEVREYLVTRRLPGMSLSTAWPTLSSTATRRPSSGETNCSRGPERWRSMAERDVPSSTSSTAIHHEVDECA